MSLMPSLCAALERAGGDRLVMRAGERPHVLAGERRHDVASAILSVNAVEALAEQILSSSGREALTATGSVSETVSSPSFPKPLIARAERVGDDLCIELIVSVSADQAEAPVPDAATLESRPSEPASVGRPAPVDQILSFEAASGASQSSSDALGNERGMERPPVETRRADVTVVTRVQEPSPPSPLPIDASDLLAWIGRAADLGATTLYLRAGSPAAARIDERIQPISQDAVAPSVIDEATGAFARGGDGLWEARPDGEWVRDDEDLGWLSCRAFTDLEGTGLIIQVQPATSLRLLYKHIPRQVRLACEGNGLVVVAAATEADVEGLAAAVADWSGRARGGYLVSLQRRSAGHGDIAGAFVSLRTIEGSDKDFAAAIRRAAQERPDILLVTGLQDEQALQAAVLASAGGRLVIVGVVAHTTVDALQMVAGADPHVRHTMAASFRAAIGYRSLRRIGGGRTLVQDVVLATGPVCDLLEAGDFDGIVRSQRVSGPGLRSVDESLARAVRRGHVSLREAASQAVDRGRLIALVRHRHPDSGRGAAQGGADFTRADITAGHGRREVSQAAVRRPEFSRF